MELERYFVVTSIDKKNNINCTLCDVNADNHKIIRNVQRLHSTKVKYASFNTRH
jgi:hypothetical protein